MTDLAIKAEGLGKLYRIGAAREKYYTFRDALVNTVKAPFRRLASLRGKSRSDNEMFWALKDVSFDVRHGEVLGIIGRNGAGKSTLLKILARVTEPTEGQADIYGRVGSLLEVGTGFHPELTGLENIYLSGAVLGMRKAEIDNKFDEIVDFAGVEKFLYTPAKRYSSGMYVRLAFAVAAHLEPEILLVDEVLAVGDAEFQKKCLGKMGEVAKGGRTVLFVSHNMAAVRTLCQRAILIDKGLITLNGQTTKVIDTYMSRGVQSRAAVIYEPDPKKHVQIMKVIVLNHQGMPSARLDMLQPFTIQIEYEVREKVSGVVIGANIFTSHNESLLATCDFDLDRNKLLRREQGRHITWVTLPGKIFNSGKFYLVIGISIPGKVIYDRREVMDFELFDSGSFVVDGGGEERRNSILLMELPWDVG
jgi:lipopolysaccharide transport system ATP-binding protein